MHPPDRFAHPPSSFNTVAEEFGFTAENAPRFTAFATTKERLVWHLDGEHRQMFAYYDVDKIVGYPVPTRTLHLSKQTH